MVRFNEIRYIEKLHQLLLLVSSLGNSFDEAAVNFSKYITGRCPLVDVMDVYSLFCILKYLNVYTVPLQRYRQCIPKRRVASTSSALYHLHGGCS